MSALVFALSPNPDEVCIPSPAFSAADLDKSIVFWSDEDNLRSNGFIFTFVFELIFGGPIA